MRKQSPFFALVLCLPEKSKSKTGFRQKFWREKGCRQKFWREEGRRQKKWEHHLISGKTGNFWERHGENPDAWSFGARFFATEATQWNWKKCAQILWESEFWQITGMYILQVCHFFPWQVEDDQVPAVGTQSSTKAWSKWPCQTIFKT